MPTEPDFDELEPGVVVTEELKRLVHHFGQVAHRLRDLADAGESGSTPFIEIAAVTRWLVPFVLLTIGIALGI